MMRKILALVITLSGLGAVFMAFPPGAAAADPVVGADAVPGLYSPALAGAGDFTTSRGGAPASALNPAAGGDAQRIVFDIGYLGIPGKEGKESSFGHAFELGALFPTRTWNFGGSVRFLKSPFDLSFPVGTTFGGNLNAAKELYPGVSLGLGLNLGAGTGDEWSLSGDLGFRYTVGNLLENKAGFLHNFTWAAVLRSLGKSEVPTAFTPVGGVAFDLLHFYGAGDKPDPFSFGIAADLGFPGFTNIMGKAGLKAVIAELVTVSASSGFNGRELAWGAEPSLVPSIGLTVNFTLKSGGQRLVGGALPSDGDLAVAAAFKPLYKDIFAAGAGLTWYVGVADKKPPVIDLDYAETAYISPNHDGNADALEFPLGITDQRYVMEWVFEISDENGAAARTYRNKEIRPETQTVRNVLARLFSVKSGVDIPESLRWDGVLESGERAPDGKYFFTVSAADDNGNTAKTERYEVIIDTVPPEARVAEMEGALKVFSPDGDGNKDTLTIRQSGSREDLWEGGIYDAGGNRVKTFTVTNGEPADLVWDGGTDAGGKAPDGVYSYRISATDRAKNTGGASLDNIILDTRAAGAFLTSSVSAVAPKAGQSGDPVQFGIFLSLQEGIDSWKLELKDQSGGVFRTLDGPGGARVPPASIGWNGMDERGLVREGVYTPALTVNYTKGDVVSATGSPVTVDVSGPELAFNSRPEYFSPDNDGVDDELFINLSAADVSPIAGWSLEIREPEPPYPVFYRIEGRGSPAERIVWDGRSSRGELVQAATDYPYTFKAEDILGNASAAEGRIGVDVLVIRDGDRLKIQVPSIVFRANYADFEGLAPEVVDNNNRILRRIAQILNKFRDYKVQVEGHANPTTPEGPERNREQPELQRISESRARAVVDWLARNGGVARSRLSASGVGGSRTVVPYTDTDNRWKNRRVEFILIK
jgi:flagellar motor protein MotB